MNDISNCLLESLDSVVLIAHPTCKHHIFRCKFDKYFAFIAVHRPCHDESVGIASFSIVVESSIVLVGILLVRDISLEAVWVRHRPEKVNQRIWSIAFPSIKSHIQNPIHHFLEPCLRFRIKKVNKSSFSLPPVDGLALV